MSSHHVVRENQEPALIVSAFDAIGLEDLGQLLEWSPSILTDQSNLDFLLAEGIKVDILFGIEKCHTTQENVLYVPLGDTAFLDAALQYLVGHRYSAVNILCNDVSEIPQKFASRINVVVFCGGRRFAFVSRRYEKWKRKGEYVFVEERHVETVSGLEIISNGIYRTSSDGFFVITLKYNQYVLIGEEI